MRAFSIVKLAACALLLGLSQSTLAAVENCVTGAVTVDGNAFNINFANAAYDNTDHTWVCSVEDLSLGNGISLDWEIRSDLDPLLRSSIAVTNTTAAPVHFTFVTTLLTTFGGPTKMGGSTSGSLTDADFIGGASLSSFPATPIYTALIDGTPQFTLLNDPQSFIIPGASTTIGPDSLGLPTLTIPGPGITSSMQIRHEFVLSPGDQASFTSSFRVEAVPEPASFAVLGLAGVMIVSSRRRREI